MRREKIVFVCQKCGQTYSKWQGKCDVCGEWNTLAEEISLDKEVKKGQKTRDKKLMEEFVVSAQMAKAFAVFLLRLES